MDWLLALIVLSQVILYVVLIYSRRAAFWLGWSAGRSDVITVYMATSEGDRPGAEAPEWMRLMAANDTAFWRSAPPASAAHSEDLPALGRMGGSHRL